MTAFASTPAMSQMIVFGDSGGHACYNAARTGNDSLGALDDCTHALETNLLNRRDRAATHHNRGIIHRLRGDLDAAMADYHESQRLEPDMPESYVSEGNVLYVMDDFDGALRAYDAALERDLPVAHVAHYNRGLVYEAMERLDAAEQAFNDAAAASPEWRLPQEGLARIAEKRAAIAAQAARRNGS
ncbi:MAG: tetratricopeptide repeat protein [Maricaulaceae bacterium]